LPVKLGPRQFIGLGAIVVFGSILVLRLTQPSEKEKMDRVIASLPTISAPTAPIELPPLNFTAPEIPPLPDNNLPSAATPAVSEPEVDYAALGSQAAKDDLYCAGLLEAHFPVLLENEGVTKAGINLEHRRMLAGAGVEKLRAQGLAGDIDWVAYANAHGALALADYSANKPRIPLSACEARGAALPANTPKLP